MQRTRELLKKALIDLIRERGYAGLTVKEIAERADVGRTTFYAHYGSKDDLFMSCHEAIVCDFSSGSLFSYPLSREELLAPEAPPGRVAAYRHLADARLLLHPIFQGRDGAHILGRMRAWSAEAIEANLRAAFDASESRVPLDVLATYLAGAQIALMQWWLSQRRPHTAEVMAQALNRLQQAAVREAFGLGEEPRGLSTPRPAADQGR
ncbi:MAG: TetR/AcrR family transcriptional regulator [Candidatus Promineifilaceae bacterium]